MPRISQHRSGGGEPHQAPRRGFRPGAGPIEPARAAALGDLRALDIERHGHGALFDRFWALRDNLTAYDAAYVALAEALGTTLMTCDRKLARSPGMASRIALVS